MKKLFILSLLFLILMPRIIYIEIGVVLQKMVKNKSLLVDVNLTFIVLKNIKKINNLVDKFIK